MSHPCKKLQTDSILEEKTVVLWYHQQHLMKGFEPKAFLACNSLPLSKFRLSFHFLPRVFIWKSLRGLGCEVRTIWCYRSHELLVLLALVANAHSGFFRLSSIRPITSSSGTSLPPSIRDLALFPSSVPAATASRNKSPVAKWQRQRLSLRLGAWVPFPDPGGPMSMMFNAGFLVHSARR